MEQKIISSIISPIEEIKGKYEKHILDIKSRTKTGEENLKMEEFDQVRIECYEQFLSDCDLFYDKQQDLVKQVEYAKAFWKEEMNYRMEIEKYIEKLKEKISKLPDLGDSIRLSEMILELKADVKRKAKQIKNNSYLRN